MSFIYKTSDMEQRITSLLLPAPEAELEASCKELDEKVTWLLHNSRKMDNYLELEPFSKNGRLCAHVCDTLKSLPETPTLAAYKDYKAIIILLGMSTTHYAILDELAGESPLLVKLIMQSIYKNNDRKVRHLGSKRFGIQFLIKGIYTYNGMLYVHTQTKNSSNVPFDTDFIRFKITDKKVPKRTAIQETVLDAVRSYNEVIEIAGKSTVRTVYALPKFTIPDDKLLVVELYEKNGGRHQTIRVENADIVNAEVIDELKIK